MGKIGLRKKNTGIIGWREWVALPDLGIKKIKAKVDTGARSSSIHAVDLEIYERNQLEHAKFKIYPDQKDDKMATVCQAEIMEYREIRSSNGQSERRPVILTDVVLLGERWPIELTLTNRDEMGFRMLLGRESFRDRFLVDAGRSFYGKRVKHIESEER